MLCMALGSQAQPDLLFCLLNVAVRREPPGCKGEPEGLRPSATVVHLVHLFLNKLCQGLGPQMNGNPTR